jgi:H+/Cl- antiporter ClcA
MAGASSRPQPPGRLRVSPLISRRLPSGRGATGQPNVTGDRNAAQTPLFWVMVVLTGVTAGLLGDAIMRILHAIQHVAFGYRTERPGRGRLPVNGKDMAHDAFLGIGSLSLLLALSALKPPVTALCLGSGASGGLFTPTLSAGAVLGGATGIAWSLARPGSPAGAYALAGLALTLELTHGGFRSWSR